MRRVILVVVPAVLAATFAVSAFHEPTRSALGFMRAKWSGPYTVEERLKQFGSQVAGRLKPSFARAGLAYPPHEIAHIAFKDRRVLELYARGSEDEPWRFVKQYGVLGASGRLGPKLAEGDYQVPEGIYQAEFLNPNSRFHVSIRLNYPNQFDREVARLDSRVNLGGDIMIHGSSASIGCLAMGDEAAEELFTLAALVTKARTRIVVSPTDLRLPRSTSPALPQSWGPKLYEAVRLELQKYQREPGPSVELTFNGRGASDAAHVKR